LSAGNESEKSTAADWKQQSHDLTKYRSKE